MPSERLGSFTSDWFPIKASDEEMEEMNGEKANNAFFDYSFSLVLVFSLIK